MSAQIDHLVVAAPSLDAGVAWAEATLGVTPAPGGAHPLFGTHNRLLHLSGPAACYLEIIAIDPNATPLRLPPLKRWFDLDDPALQARITAQGPQLLHWVARVDGIGAAYTALAAQGIERGHVIEASRPTPEGLLRWQITVRDDGQRLFDGALPTLIQWNGRHPSEHLPPSGLRLQALRLAHPEAPRLQAALSSIGIEGVAVHTTGPRLSATLHTPLGLVSLTTP